VVAVRLHRQAIEVLMKTPVIGGLHRQELEAAFSDDSTGGTTRIHRHAIEVMTKTPVIAQLSRQEMEVAVFDESTGGTTRIHRQGLEVLAKVPAKAALSRQELEVAVSDVSTGGATRLHRQGVEVLARKGVPPPTPIALPAGLDFFLHNWVSQVEMETSYLTDVTRSPTTLAESRRNLLQRPLRTVTLDLLHGEKAEVDRLMHALRRITNDQTVMPIFQDAVVVEASSSASNVINGSFRYRRYFNGGRVAVFTSAPTSKSVMLTADIDIYTIGSVFASSLTVDRNLDQTYAADLFLIVPLMDMDPALEMGITNLTDDTAAAKVTMNETVGRNALPPSFTGVTPDGFRTELGLPVFELRNDWGNNIRPTYLRYGSKETSGRRAVVETEGPRYVQVQEHHFKADRPLFWNVLQMFDAKRGRTDPFWEVDQEFVWDVVSTTNVFIDITPQGIFTDYQNDFTDHCGIVMKDGTVYIREVNTISDVGSWRITIAGGNDLPSIDVTQIARFSRARKKRFQSDALTETWHTTEQAELTFSTIEVLNEGEIIV
jgi:hypothetical protein